MDAVKFTWVPQVAATWVEHGCSLERGSRLGLPQTVLPDFCLNKPPPFLQCGGRLGGSVRSELTDKTALIN